MVDTVIDNGKTVKRIKSKTTLECVLVSVRSETVLHLGETKPTTVSSHVTHWTESFKTPFASNACGHSREWMKRKRTT